jgi:hypothetical protein
MNASTIGTAKTETWCLRIARFTVRDDTSTHKAGEPPSLTMCGAQNRHFHCAKKRERAYNQSAISSSKEQQRRSLRGTRCSVARPHDEARFI